MDLVNRLQQIIASEYDHQGLHGLIVWYDQAGTMQSIVQKSLPEGVNLLFHGGSYLKLRFQLETQDPNFEHRWLVYIPLLPPKESWLRDWELIGTHWQKDLLDFLNDEEGLGINQQTRSLLREHPNNAKQLVSRWNDVMQSRLVTIDSISEALLALNLGIPSWQIEQAIFEVIRFNNIEERLAPSGLWDIFCHKIWSYGGWEGRTITKEEGLRKRLQSTILLSELVIAHNEFKDRFSSVLPLENKLSTFAGIARSWREREDLRATYLQSAQNIEREYQLSDLLIPDEDLLKAETFFGIDEMWRKATVQCVATDGSNYAEKSAQIHKIAENRSQYFWAKQDRALYWEPISCAASLYEGCKRAIELIPNVSSIDEFIRAYSVDHGWWELDYYALLSAAHAGNLREDERSRLLYPAWRVYGQYLDQVNTAFGNLVTSAGWRPIQHLFWSQYITGISRTAVFMVDALRYDLAKKLLDDLKLEGYITDITTTISSLPSITEIGMSSLLPGAEHGLEVDIQNSKLTVKLNGHEVTSYDQRRTWLLQKLPPNNKIIQLDQIEQQSLDNINLLIVTSREIDTFGTFAANIDPAGLLDLVKRIAKGIKVVNNQGFERVFVVTDHGFYYLPPDVAPEGISRPTAKICKRRFAVGANPQGCVVKSSTEIGLQGDETYAFPRGLATFQIQGETGSFLHGGISLQECIIPAIEIKPAVIYEKVKVVLEEVTSITSRIVNVTIKALNFTMFSLPRRVTVEIGDHTSPVIEINSQNQSRVARVEWLGFADTPPSHVIIRLKDADNLQVLEEKKIKVELFL